MPQHMFYATKEDKKTFSDLSDEEKKAINDKTREYWKKLLNQKTKVNQQ